MAKKAKAEEVKEPKKTPGTILLIAELEQGAKTVDELAESCGISVNTVKVQLSYHLKMKGYVVEKTVGEDKVARFTITGQGDPLPKPEKKVKAVEEVAEEDE